MTFPTRTEDEDQWWWFDEAALRRMYQPEVTIDLGRRRETLGPPLSLFLLLLGLFLAVLLLAYVCRCCFRPAAPLPQPSPARLPRGRLPRPAKSPSAGFQYGVVYGREDDESALP